MRRLPYIIIICFISVITSAQSPHGKNMKYDCSDCHNSNNWKIIPKELKFDHSKTKFALDGQHRFVECRQCHSNLDFTLAKNNCIDCHKDIHKNSVSNNCSKCHTPETWLVSKVDQIHQQSRFPLIGNHRNQSCGQCHAKYSELNFEPLGITCYDCHAQNYLSSEKPNHVAANFSKDCVTCHKVSDFKWSTTQVNHDFFPLTGGHNIANCYACHKNNSLTKVSNECYSCHQNNYNQVSNPNHAMGKFPTTCSQCHSINSWKPSTFNHSNTNFPLVGKHSNVTCNSCHVAGFSGMNSSCYSCHKANYDATTNPNHISVGFQTTCSDCHTPNGWTPATFDHDGKFFPIYSGAHKGQWNVCADCHITQNNYANFSCLNCHDHNQQKTDFDHSAISGYAYISSACYSCHKNGSKSGAFNHNLTAFPLTGSHNGLECSLCHKSSSSLPKTDCYSCHTSKYTSTTNPNHIVLGISTDCKSCHTASGWTPSTFNHSNTAFVLSGAHLTVACASCHKGKTTGTSQVCFDCHSSNYDQSLNPNHKSVGLSTDCKSCHNSIAWSPSTFNHSNTAFVLSGAHLTVACSSCHQGKTTGTSQNCFDCHTTNYNQSLNPNHKSIGISTDCKSCHNTIAWTPSTFNHSNTAFVLSGAHLTVACEFCHKGKTTGTSILCYSCHQSNFTSVADPNHVAGNFPTTCEQCHTTTAWKPASFDHSKTTFPITGKHTNVACNQCHINGYTNTSSNCNSCHLTNYNSTTNPNHIAIGISTDCKVCHNTNGWTPSTFNHSSTAFVLSGVHLQIACASCHKGKTTGTSQICFDCHSSSYDQSLNPNHKAIGISTDCKNCHNSTAWIPSTFNHSNTAFILTGAHLTTACASCHAGKTTGTSGLCYSCHQAKYNSVVDPNHVTGKFPTTCEQCHSTTAWKPATFNHALTVFPLTGKHTSVACSQCHANGYANTPTDCYSCHKTAYNNSTNPNHSLAQFPTTCSSCHTTNGWTPSTFNHDGNYFRIYSGAHRGRWNLCADCHNVPSDYKVFTCTTSCHPQAKMNSEHSGKSGYQYQSSACYSCHRNA